MAISTVKYVLLAWFILITTCLLLYFPTKSTGDTNLVGDNAPVAVHDKEVQLRIPVHTHITTEPYKVTPVPTIAPVSALGSNINSIVPIVGVTATHSKDGAVQLVSLHKPAYSDVRGNLGPASCITNETVSNWLADRWQGVELPYAVADCNFTSVICLYCNNLNNFTNEY